MALLPNGCTSRGATRQLQLLCAAAYGALALRRSLCAIDFQTVLRCTITHCAE